MSVNIIRSIVLVIIVLVLSCEEYFLPLEIEGCITESACNYNQEATVLDTSCISPQGCNEWCEGDEGAPLQLDCREACGTYTAGTSLLGTGIFECLKSWSHTVQYGLLSRITD